MSLMNKVCVNIDQSNSATGGFTDAEKAQARTNIGAGTGNSNSTIVHDSNTLPPVTTNVNQMTIFDDGRARFDNLYYGVIPSEPGQSESGRVLVANYTGSPAKGTAQWNDVHNIGINEVPSGGSNGQVLTWNSNTYAWANAASELPAHTSSDAGKALILNSSGNPIWSNIDSSPSISRISEFKTNDSPSMIGTTYGSEHKRVLHSFTEGTYPNTISAWIQERDYKYGILHYTMALELWNSDTVTKWCVIDQGHTQNVSFHIIGKGLYIPFAPGHTYVPIDHTVVFLKSDVGNILSTIMVVMGLQTWPSGDPNFHADDMFQVSTIHSNLTLFNW